MKENMNTSNKAEKFWDRTANIYDQVEKPLLNSLLSIGSKIGIIPEIKSFKTDELDNLFIKGNFELIETDYLKQNSPQYPLITKKLKSV